MLRELIFAFRLSKAAEQGKPLVLVVRQDKTLDILWPTMIRGNIVQYYDPVTKRYELLLLHPESLLHMGKVVLIPHVQGYLESLGWEELGSLLFAKPQTVRRLQENLLRIIQENGGLSQEEKDALTRAVSTGNVIAIAEAWRYLRGKNLIRDVEPPQPPAFIYVPEHVAAVAEKIRLRFLSEAMGYIKYVSGLQKFFSPGFNWKTLLAIGAIILILFIIMGALGPLFAPHGAATAPPPKKI